MIFDVNKLTEFEERILSLAAFVQPIIYCKISYNKTTRFDKCFVTSDGSVVDDKTWPSHKSELFSFHTLVLILFLIPLLTAVLSTLNPMHLLPADTTDSEDRIHFLENFICSSTLSGSHIQNAVSYSVLIDIKNLYCNWIHFLFSPASLLPSIATENRVAFILSTNFEVRSIVNASFKMADDFVLPHWYFSAILLSGKIDLNNFPDSSDIAFGRLCLANNTVILISAELSGLVRVLEP